jgi:hypothetical protein
MASSGVGGGSASGGPPQANPPRSERPGPPSGQERIVSYQPEERYWTDYLRIALPTIGLLILLGLFWWWAKELIGDDDDQPPTPSPAVAVVDEVNATPPPVAPTATSAALTPEAGAPTATAVPAQTEPTPTTPEDAEEPPAADDAADAGTDAADAEPLLTTYEVGAQVVTTEDVNMRTEPIEGEVVVVVDANTPLVVTGEFFNAPGGERDWWPVRNEETGQEGFIREDFLEEAS